MKYDTPKQHLKRLKLKRILYKLKCLGLTMLFVLSIYILYICITSDNDTQKLNNCLQTHDFEYCNKVVK